MFDQFGSGSPNKPLSLLFVVRAWTKLVKHTVLADFSHTTTTTTTNIQKSVFSGLFLAFELLKFQSTTQQRQTQQNSSDKKLQGMFLYMHFLVVGNVLLHLI